MKVYLSMLGSDIELRRLAESSVASAPRQSAAGAPWRS